MIIREWIKYNFECFALIATCLLASPAIANVDIEADEDKRLWGVHESNLVQGGAHYRVQGNVVWGHNIGFVKSPHDCKKDLLVIEWSTYNKGASDLKGQDINMTLSTDIYTFNVDVPLVAVFKPDFLIAEIAVFSDIIMPNDFFKSLGKKRSLTVTIDAPDKSPVYFDIPTDYFNLDNLQEVRLEAAVQCLNANEDSKGQYTLALMLNEGVGVLQDFTLARSWMSKSAINGYAPARTALGLLAESDGEKKAAIIYFESAAKQGHALAQYKMGYYQYYGKVVKKERAKAFSNFLLSAQGGNSESLAFLADMYHNGDGIKKDDKEALNWARKSAATDDVKGQYLLGLLLYRGSAGVLDRPLAEEWFLKAANRDYDLALTAMGQVEHDKKNYSAAMDWFKRSADTHNNKRAQWMIGKYYTDSRYLPNNAAEGIKYLELAANQNWDDAMLDLATLYAGESLVDQDQMLAAEWIKKSASSGNSASQLLIADFLSNGKLVDGENFVEALSWALVSAENGNSDALKTIEDVKEELFKPLIVLAEQLSKICIESNYKECELAL
jgi:hypothetical protein